MAKRKTLRGGLALLAGGIIASTLTTGCTHSRPMNLEEPNKRYATMAISRVDEFYSGEVAKEFKKAYQEVQKLPSDKFKEYLEKYNSNEKWFLGQVNSSDKELRKRFPWGNNEQLNNTDKVLIVQAVKSLWKAIESATYNTTNPCN